MLKMGQHGILFESKPNKNLMWDGFQPPHKSKLCFLILIMEYIFTMSCNTQSDEINASSVFTLASLLVTVSTIFIAMLATNANLTDPSKTHNLNILFGVIGFISVSAAALLVDWVLDERLQKNFFERINFMNGGYLVFSLAMSLVSFGVLFATKYSIQISITNDNPSRFNFLFSLTSICLFFKIMIKADHHTWLIALVLLACSSFFSIIDPSFLVGL